MNKNDSYLKQVEYDSYHFHYKKDPIEYAEHERIVNQTDSIGGSHLEYR